MVERRNKKISLVNRGVAQLVERDIWDIEAVGSRPITPTNRCGR